MYQLLAAALSVTLGSTQIADVPTRHAASCTAEHEPARIVRSVQAELPPLAQIMHLSGTALIRVDLSDNGYVVGSSVATSTGNGVLDQAALRAVESMDYAAERQSCKAVAGSYGVEVKFPD